VASVASVNRTIVGLALLLAAAPARAESPVEPGKVFVGAEGVTVAVVPLKPRTDKKVLVRVTGSGTVFDDKVILHKLEDSDGRRTNYETTYRGRDFVTLTVRDSAYSLHVPGKRDGGTLKFDDGKSKALNAEELHKTHQKQQADGTLQALAAFNRKEETARHEKQLDETVASFSKRCGYKLPIKVNWSSISDDDIKELSLASYCGEPIDTMGRLCEDSAEAKKTIGAAVKSFSCTMGPAMQLDLQGTTLNWTTSRSGRNMGDFARKYLEKKL
jgi:hypothetical protein